MFFYGVFYLRESGKTKRWESIMTDVDGHAIMRAINGVKRMGLFDQLKRQKAKQGGQRPMMIYGLCGPLGVGAHKSGEARYWWASVLLKAWQEEGGALREEKIRLEKACDEEGVHALQQQLLPGTIFHARVRFHENGLELLDLLETDCAHAQLQPIKARMDLPKTAVRAASPQTNIRPAAEERTQPAQTDITELARHRETLEFAKGMVEIRYEKRGPAYIEDCQTTLRRLMHRQNGWKADALQYAANAFLPFVQEANPKQKWTKKGFKEQLRLERIDVLEKGNFVFYLDAGSLLADRQLFIIGSLEEKFTRHGEMPRGS